MKKYILILFRVLCFPFIAKAEVCNTSKVTVSDVKVEQEFNNIVEEGDPTFLNKSIHTNLRFYEVGDGILYSFVVKNESDNDFVINKDNFNVDSQYIKYTLSTTDNNMIVKGNEEKTFYLKIMYEDEVPQQAFQNNTFESSNSFQLNLSNDSFNDNPKTGTIPSLIIMALLLSLVIIFSMLHMKKQSSFVLVIALLLIPNIVYALCSLNIQVTNDYVISNNPKFCFEYNDQTVYFEYEEGMTFEQYINSGYNDNYFYKKSNFSRVYPNFEKIFNNNDDDLDLPIIGLDCNCLIMPFDGGYSNISTRDTITNSKCYTYYDEFCGPV